MKRIIAIIAIAILAACATPPVSPTVTPTVQKIQATVTQACTAYGAAFSAALDARRAGKLSLAQIKSIGAIDAQVTPICTGALPADTQAAVIQITAAIANMAIAQGAK